MKRRYEPVFLQFGSVRRQYYTIIRRNLHLPPPPPSFYGGKGGLRGVDNHVFLIPWDTKITPDIANIGRGYQQVGSVYDCL